jgi:tetratricopeptide (TPR) repeat protein
MNMTLREVSERLEVRGERFPTSTLVRVEQGKLDPGVRRLHLLMDLYRIPPDLVADLIELEERDVEEPEQDDPETLRREAVRYLTRGDTAQALARIFVLKHRGSGDPATTVRRQQAAIDIASAARDVGKFRLAQELVEHVLRDGPDASVVARALVLAAALWHGWGSWVVAIALVRQAATHVEADDLELKAWVMLQEAGLLLDAGELDDAARLADRVLRMQRKRGDREGETRALLLQARILEVRGDAQATARYAERALKIAREEDLEVSWISGLLLLGGSRIDSGEVERGLEHLNEALSKAMLIKNGYLEFHAHYRLWKAYAVLDDRDREQFELQAASYFERFVDEASPEGGEVRKLTYRKDGPTRRRGGSGRRSG